MGFNLIERVFDEEKIHSMVKPLFDDVVEDGTAYECFDLNVKRDCWLSVDNYKALFHVQPFNRTTLDLHCYIPIENRNKSKAYALQAIEWINKEAPLMYKKIITQVPSIYRHIKIFVLSLGFEFEGSYKKSFLKHGRLWDLNLFGMVRA